MKKKKITWIIVSCLCIVVASFGVMGFNDTPVSAEVSKETKGSFVRLEDGAKKIVITADGKETVYTLSATAWVYRNMQKSTLAELQPGDTLDLILNNKDQAAYIKATGSQTASAQNSTPSPAAADEASSQAAAQVPPPGASTAPAEGQAAAGTSSAVGSQPLPPAVGSGTASSQQPKGLAGEKTENSNGQIPKSIEKLSMEWKSQELKLEIKLDSSSQGKNASELYVQTKDRAVIHLTGASAEAFIQMLIKGLPMERQAFELAVKQRIAGEFQLKEAKPEWKLDVEWREASEAPAAASSDKLKGYEKEKHENGQDKGKDKDKDKDKDKGKSGDDDKGNERGKGNNKDDDRDDRDDD